MGLTCAPAPGRRSRGQLRTGGLAIRRTRPPVAGPRPSRRTFPRLANDLLEPTSSAVRVGCAEVEGRTAGDAPNLVEGQVAGDPPADPRRGTGRRRSSRQTSSRDRLPAIHPPIPVEGWSAADPSAEHSSRAWPRMRRRLEMRRGEVMMRPKMQLTMMRLWWKTRHGALGREGQRRRNNYDASWRNALRRHLRRETTSNGMRHWVITLRIPEWGTYRECSTEDLLIG